MNGNSFRLLGSICAAWLLTASAVAQPVTPQPEPAPAPAEGGSAAPAALQPETPPAEPPPLAPAPEPELAPPPPPGVPLQAEVTPPPAAPAAAPVPAAPPPPAPTPTPITVTGSFFGRYELRAGYDDLGVSRPPRFLESDAIAYRARLGLATVPIEIGEATALVLQLTPQASGFYGTLPNTITDAQLNLHEGYARVQSSSFRFDLGRFELNYGDSLVIGSLDWNETGRSFDGMRARIASGPQSHFIDLFLTLIDEGRPELFEPVGAGDQYFIGVYAGLGPAIAQGLDFDLYGLLQLWPATDGIRVAPTDPMNTMTYEREAAGEVTFGVRAKQRVGMLDYRAEAGLQLGSRVGAAPMPMAMAPAELESPSVLAYQGDAELGVFVLEDKLRIGLEGLIASGDDPTTGDEAEGWNELYPTAHKFLGLADVFVQGGQKRTNVVSGVLHLTLKPVADLAIQIDGHVFSRPEAPNAMLDSGFAGAEIDAGLAYMLGKGLVLRGLYGVFLPDDDFYPVGAVMASADPAHYLEVELRYDLK